MVFRFFSRFLVCFVLVFLNLRSQGIGFSLPYLYFFLFFFFFFFYFCVLFRCFFLMFFFFFFFFGLSASARKPTGKHHTTTVFLLARFYFGFLFFFCLFFFLPPPAPSRLGFLGHIAFLNCFVFDFSSDCALPPPPRPPVFGICFDLLFAILFYFFCLFLSFCFSCFDS